MGRPAKPAAKSNLPALNDAAVAEASAAADQQAKRLAQVDALYGDGLPYSRERLITDIRSHMGRAAIDMLEAGKKLILLKEREPHGEFIESVRACGIELRLAQRLMQAAVKFLPNAKHVSHLTQSKLLDLAILDDQEIVELTQGGTVVGLTLEAIDRMSVGELRKALRDARAESGAKDQVIAGKDQKINELDKAEALKAKFADWSKEVRTWRQLIDTITTDLERPLQKARTLVRDIRKIDTSVYAGQDDVVLGPIVEWYFAALTVVRARLDQVFYAALGDIGGWLANPAVAPSRWDMPEELREWVVRCIEQERDAIRSIQRGDGA